MRTRFQIFSRLFYSLSLLAGVFIIGTLGYRIIEGYDWLDAFYMTLITVSTVGYGEVAPLTVAGKVFTSFIILICFGTFAYAISSITSYLVNGEYKRYTRLIKKQRMIEKLDNHIIVCGYGRVGRQVVTELKQNKERFVVVETKQEIFNLNDVRGGIIPVYGDATKDEILKEAGIEKAKAVITTLPNDADNLYVVLSARELNPKVKIIARASRFPSVKKMRVAGASNVIMPDSLGGAHMALLVLNPDTVDFIDQLSIHKPNSPSLVEIDFNSRSESTSFGALKDLTADVTLLGVKKANGDILISPKEDLMVEKGEKLFAIANHDVVTEFKNQIAKI
ncbi:potassium channel family protein [Luteibaculum oceani]|uniref:Potassium channel family protein n=1 Tax=Luteibaculum oceani TaxID=1294296 RepID=A0A5C6VDC7_9FLAO|nr:potassium channel family protein [Luteibaculum oceani]TXC81635.1 potassium channel family protein [Luteibaculum oceani]